MTKIKMSKFKRRISFLFLLFFFLFSSQEAFTMSSMKKIIPEILEGVVKGGKTFHPKPPKFPKPKPPTDGGGVADLVLNPSWGRAGVQIYRNYCIKSENKKTAFCRDPDTYCNQKMYSGYHICRESTKQLKKEKRKQSGGSGGFPFIFVLIIIGGIAYFIFKKPKDRKQESSTNTDDGQWSSDFKPNIFDDFVSGIKKEKASDDSSVESRLKKLKKLFDDNIISKEEYEEQRKKIIRDV